jgi:hypothetical protein
MPLRFAGSFAVESLCFAVFRGFSLFVLRFAVFRC